MNSDLLIIGGGVIGLSIARELNMCGVRKIAVVDRGLAGREASWAAAGMLAPQAEADQADEFFHFCSESRDSYPQLAEELRNETGIDIELDRSGTLHAAFTDSDVSEIEKRFEWQKNAGLNVEKLSSEETLSTEPFLSPDVLESLFFPNDWHVENRKLIAALLEYSRLHGIDIIENASVQNLLVENSRIIGAETDSARLFAGSTILATGAWTSLITIGDSPLGLAVKPVRGQMIGFDTGDRRLQKVVYSGRGYLVPKAAGRILAGATVEDVGFERGVTESGIRSLRQMALEIAPGLGKLEVKESWAGLRPFSPDGLPVVGAISGIENLTVATAHYRNGILLAPLTAKIVAAKIAETSESPYLSIYSPDRFAKSACAA